MVPCIPVSELPKQLCLKAPIPSRRPHNGSHCKFLREVHQGIESGEEILFVEARLQKWSPSLRYSPTIQLSWGIHIGQLEDRAFGFLNSLTKTKVFEDVVILINAIKEEHAYCLHAVTNKVINHAMFFQNRRSLGKLTQTQDWLLAVLRTIQVQMRLNVFPNFFLSKQNIFMESNSQVLKFNYDELTRLIRNLKKYRHPYVVTPDVKNWGRMNLKSLMIMATRTMKVMKSVLVLFILPSDYLTCLLMCIQLR